uniref:protein SIX6OS1 n=1 Tax=Semicossyphus pulcher TaxID=241346 RepID=UPI0037E895BB
MHNKACAKSIKVTNSLLLQYEQTLKEELESRKASYNHDMEVYEERIASYKKTFQSHKNYYCQNPLAQKLLTLQAEKEEIESRIKACEEQITMKQKELDNLTRPAPNSSSNEKLSDSVPGQQPITEPEKPLDPQTEEDSDSSIDISSLHLNQTKDGHKTEKVYEKNKVKDKTECSPVQEEEEIKGMRPCQELDEQRWTDVMHTDEENKEAGPEDQEHQSTASVIEEAEEEVEIEEGVAKEKEQAPSTEDNGGPTAFPQLSSQDTNPQSSPASVKAAPSTPTFPFNFSPAGSPHRGTSDTKSPAFLFSLNPDPSTPGFSGFGFDVGSSQDEDSSFAFTGSFFNEKKTTESKSSSSEFPFGQPEQSEEFHFAFSSKSPQTTKKDNSADDFPFSFNF